MTVTALSLNIWNYRGGWRGRRGRIVRLIHDIRPDIVALQEVRRDPRHHFDVNQAAQLARRAGLHAVYAPATRYWLLPPIEEGLAILTPHCVIEHAVVPLRWDRHHHRDPNRRIALRATVALPGGVPLNCWVTHLNLVSPLREESAAALCDAIRAHPSPLPPLLMGDFNAEPGQAAIRTIDAHDLRDMWPIAHPDDPGFTYPAEAPTERIDYLFAGPGWQVTHMERIGTGVPSLSDHCGLLATLVLPTGAMSNER